MAQVLLSKPSPIHNVGYILLGFYLASLITFDLNLLLEQKIAFAIAFGSFIGTLVYYIKPIERAISFYFRISKKNVTYPSEPFEEFQTPVFKSDVLLSNYLQDERAIINGAFFMALGILTSNSYLESINLSHLYWWLQIFTTVLICIGLWEIFTLITKKIPILVFFYNYLNISDNIASLEQAIQTKDWIRAQKIMDREPELTDFDLYVNYYPQPKAKKGICLTCGEIREVPHCTVCGKKVKTHCSHCKGLLIEEGDEIVPKFCRHCGREIKEEKPTETGTE
jgi:hypothetical protein